VLGPREVGDAYKLSTLFGPRGIGGITQLDWCIWVEGIWSGVTLRTASRTSRAVAQAVTAGSAGGDGWQDNSSWMPHLQDQGAGGLCHRLIHHRHGHRPLSVRHHHPRHPKVISVSAIAHDVVRDGAPPRPPLSPSALHDVMWRVVLVDDVLFPHGVLAVLALVPHAATAVARALHDTRRRAAKVALVHLRC
jgi:hypothetical protein